MCAIGLERRAMVLTRIRLVILLSPMLSVALLAAPMALLPSLYAKLYGISLIDIGMLLLLIRVLDGFTDILVGHVSDYCRVRYGSRKPFVIAGALIIIPCSYLLVHPVGNDVTLLSFACWSTAFYLGYTFFNIPLLAFLAEMSSVSDERTYMFSVYSFLARAAGLMFFSIPFLPIFDTQSVNLEVLEFSVFLGAAIMLPAIFLFSHYAPNGSPPMSKKKSEKLFSNMLSSVNSAFIVNGPFQFYIAAYVFIGLGMGMFSGLLFMYVDIFLGLGEIYAKIMAAGLGFGLIVTPLCYRLAVLIGKRNSWLASNCFVILALFYCGTLDPSHAGLFQLILIQIAMVIGSVFVAVVGTAMLSDTIDYGTLKTGREASGVYFAIYTFLTKMEVALGASMGLAMAGWLGFDATVSQQTLEGGFAIRFSMCWLPLVFMFLALYFIYKSPLNESRVAIVSRRLERKAKRDKVSNPNP